MSFIWKNKYANFTTSEPIFTVLIAAAGSGQRMGGVYKPLLDLNGKPMLAYTLEAFEKNGFVKSIVVSAPKERIEEIKALAERIGCTKLYDVAEGGETRAKSVTNAFRLAFNKKENITPFVAVHDGARPLITQKNLNDVFFTCVRNGCAIAATRVRDAIKKTDGINVVTEEVDRNGLWQIQTPQAFDTDIFHTALATTNEEALKTAVDDASIVINAGFKVTCVECGATNFKVTYPEDIEMAKALLSYRKEEA